MGKFIAGVVSMVVAAAAFAETPDTFTWSFGGNGGWFDAGAWTPTDTERTAPGIAGDTAVMQYDKTVTLGESVALSEIRGGFQIVGSGSPTVTMVAAPGRSAARIFCTGTPNGLAFATAFGDYLSEEKERLTVKLESPLSIEADVGDYTRRMGFRAKISGGTKESPCGITLTKNSKAWTAQSVMFLNPANDFVGDIHLAGDSADYSSQVLQAGLDSVTATDSMFGDAANEIWFDGGHCRVFLSDLDADGLKRKIHGSGEIRSFHMSTMWWEENQYRVLCLGDGFLSDPSSPGSVYGSQTLTCSQVVMDGNAGMVFDVGSDDDGPKCDTVNVVCSAAKPFAYSGMLAINENGEVPAGTSFTLLTVQPNPSEFSFAPSVSDARYAYKIVGDRDVGWTVVATKRRDGADVSARAATLVGDTYATFNCELAQGSGAAETITAYYGTADAGSDIAAWQMSAVIATGAATLGTYSAVVSGLVPDRKYFIRFGVTSGGETHMSFDVVEVTPRALTTPDVFYWDGASGAWHAEPNPWRINGAWARLVPGLPGDAVNLVCSGTDRTLTLDDDVAVGRLYGFDGEYSWTITCSQPHTLTLATADGSPAVVSRQRLTTWNFGTGTDGLTLRLAGETRFDCDGSYTYNVYLNAKITGGTDERPSTLWLGSSANEWSGAKYVLLNADNDFRGDIHLAQWNENLAGLELFVGDATHPADDAMLGAAANRVWLSHGRRITYQNAPQGVAVTPRTFIGNGGVNSDGVLSLAAGAALEPCGNDGTGFGTLTASGTVVTDARSTTYRIDIDADDTNACDKVVFKAGSPLDLQGLFVVTPDDATVRIAPGTRWAIGAIDASAGAIAAKFMNDGNAAGAFRVYAEGDATDGWTIYAQRKCPGFAIRIR